MEWREKWKLWFFNPQIGQLLFCLRVHFLISFGFLICIYFFYWHILVCLRTTCTSYCISAFARRLQLGENYLLQNVTTSPKTKMSETTVVPETDSDAGEERRNSAMDTSNSGRIYLNLLQVLLFYHILFASHTIQYTLQDQWYFLTNFFC